MAIGSFGIVRLPPRATVAVEALGGGFGGCASAPSTAIVNALEEVVQRADSGDVVSLSFGSSSFGMEVDMKIGELSRRGVVVLASTGNEASDRILSPASSPGAISVGGLDLIGIDVKWRGVIAGTGSNGRAGEVDFYGPSEEVPAPRDNSTTAFGTSNGTSLACPLVAGLAYYQLATSNFGGIPTSMLRERVEELLRTDATIRQLDQIVVPHTPTRPLYGSSRLVPGARLDLSSTSSDVSGLWLVGRRTAGPLALRVPTAGSTSEPDVTRTQVVEQSSEVGSRCGAVAAGLDQVTLGCWSANVGGQLRLYAIDGEGVDSAARFEQALTLGSQYPLSVAVDHLDSATEPAETTAVRIAVVAGIEGSSEYGNPVFGSGRSVAVARRRVDQTWDLQLVSIGIPTSTYSLETISALACRTSGDCEAYALITRTRTGVYPDTDAVQLWRVQFNVDPFVAVAPATLVAERSEPGAFYSCHVPNWAYSLGLTPVGLSVDGADGPIRWSFAYVRRATGFWGAECGFDYRVRVATQPMASLDVDVGRRGEDWSGPFGALSRGAFSRTGLVLASVWDPTIRDFRSEFVSTIRTIHGRGSAAAPDGLRHIQHSLYGDDALGVFNWGADEWSVARIRP